MAQTSGASLSNPSFRYDLHTEALVESGNRYVDVSCPESGTSFRFYEVEYAVACGMDGERDVGAIVNWAKSELALVTTKEEVKAIIGKLASLDYLDASEDMAATVPTSTSVKVPAAKTIEDASSGKLAASTEIELGYPTPHAPAPLPPADADFQLGDSGISSRKGSDTIPVSSANVELGVAGSKRATAAAPLADSSGMELGDSGNAAEAVQTPSSSVSTDLSQTFRIDKDEVKAAVRASKVMSAVELPEDLMAELDAAKEEKLAEIQAEAEDPSEAETVDVENPVRAAEAVNPVVNESPVAPVAKVDTPIAKTLIGEGPKKSDDEKGSEAATILPQTPTKVTPEQQSAVVTPAPDDATSRKPSARYWLWALLLIVVAAAAVYYYMEYVRGDKASASSTSKAPKVENAAPPADVVPPAPVVPSSTLSVADPVVSPQAAGKSGQSAFVIETGTEVDEGAVLVKLKGATKGEAAVAKNEKSLADYQLRLTRLQKGKKVTKIKAMQANVTRKEVELAKAKNRLDKLLIRSDSKGMVEVLIKPGAAVTEETVVAKVTQPAQTIAIFKIPANSSHSGISVDDKVTVVSKKDASVTATCTVIAEKGESQVTLACPDSLPAGTEISLN